MTAESFTAWRERLHLNRVQAAKALGVSRETLRLYETDKRPVPLTVALACSALAMGVPEYR